VLLTGCDGGAGGREQPLLVDATVAFPPRDTIRLSLPATTHRCTDGRSILLEAVSPEGSGVLVRLRFRDSLVSSSYPVVPPGDTTAPGAVVAVRYLLRDATHAFTFDGGTVQVRREGDKVSGRAVGSGIENAIRTPTRIQYRDVRLPERSDTVPCSFAP
jgi:hypothetical protein